MRRKLKFHPVADIFPLMDDNEFLELANDIRLNGLQEPIWVGKNDLIVDERNRHLACKQADVLPKYRNYNEEQHGPCSRGFKSRRSPIRKTIFAFIAILMLAFVLESDAFARPVRVNRCYHLQRYHGWYPGKMYGNLPLYTHSYLEYLKMQPIIWDPTLYKDRNNWRHYYDMEIEDDTDLEVEDNTDLELEDDTR